MRLTTRTIAVCVGVSVGLMVKSAFATPTDFGQGTQIGAVTGLPKLDRSARKSVREFRRNARYFGALAANSTTGDVFFVYNFHDNTEARRAAVEGCNQISRSTDCQIYEVAMPESLPLGQAKAAGFAEVAADAFQNSYRKHRKPGKFAAFAVSGSSHYGFGNAYETAADAMDTAISYCQRGVAKDMPEIGPRGRDFARARGYDVCKVVHVEQTPSD